MSHTKPLYIRRGFVLTECLHFHSKATSKRIKPVNLEKAKPFSFFVLFRARSDRVVRNIIQNNLNQTIIQHHQVFCG